MCAYQMPLFSNQTLIATESFDLAEAVFASALDVSPHAAQMQQQVRAVAAQVASSGGGVSFASRCKRVQREERPARRS